MSRHVDGQRVLLESWAKFDAERMKGFKVSGYPGAHPSVTLERGVDEHTFNKSPADGVWRHASSRTYGKYQGVGGFQHPSGIPVAKGSEMHQFLEGAYASVQKNAKSGASPPRGAAILNRTRGKNPLQESAAAGRFVEYEGQRYILRETSDGVVLQEFVSAASRRSAEDSGDTMAGGKYPIRNQSEAYKAWNLRNSGTPSTAAVVAHIRKQCKKHGLKFPGGD